MNEDCIFPGEDGFKGTLLDDYLALGYYRMLHTLFTINCVPDGYYGKYQMFMPVFWLRTIVKKVSENKSTLAIRKKCAGFTMCCKKACITEEIEELYSMYHSHIDFETPEKCSDSLYSTLIENPFDSWMIEVRDGTKLIAAGYFDIGKNAIMGILNIYHPGYRKYSLGKYLMLQKIDYALGNNIACYYSGYISTSNTKFDYKVFPDVNATEVYLPIEKEWKPYCMYDKHALNEYIFGNLSEFSQRRGTYVNSTCQLPNNQPFYIHSIN